MHRLLDKGLDELTSKVFRMGEVADKALTLAIRGYLRGKDSTEDVLEISEVLVGMSVDAEEQVFRLIAKYQPVASDLRIINSYMKIAYDFERYGRYAWDISSIGKRMGAPEDCEEWIPQFISDMGEKVLQMVKTSVASLRSLDAELARSLVKSEQEVDEMYFQFLNKLVEEAGITNQCTISSVLAVRYLERVADHTTYVGESIVYIVTGSKVTLR